MVTGVTHRNLIYGGKHALDNGLQGGHYSYAHTPDHELQDVHYCVGICP